MPDRPSIPAEIQRQILIESGHRCAVCGAGCPLERAHIIPWHRSKEHKAEDLICLCASCHERADQEQWGEKTLREYKQNPWVMRNYEKLMRLTEPKTEVELTINMEFSQFNEQQEGRLIQYALAAFLNISPNDVRIVSVRKSNSVTVTVELPAKSVQKLLYAYESGSHELFSYLTPVGPISNLTSEIALRNDDSKYSQSWRLSMKDIDFLQQYMDAVKEASNRTRQILLVMIVASILVFAAFWNTRDDGWVNSRLKDATLAVEKLGDAKTTDTRSAPALYKLQWIQKVRTEQVSQIQVPVIGVSFDVNDLGMLGGAAFIVFLIWVNYSVWHLSTNLKLALEFAKKLDKEEPTKLLYYTYQNLAMRQVLTIPPKPASVRTSEGKLKSLLQKASKLLYALPWIVQTLVVLHDWTTRDIGNRYNSNATRLVLVMEIVFWCLIVILTFICFYIWRKTYETWKTFADEI